MGRKRKKNAPRTSTSNQKQSTSLQNVPRYELKVINACLSSHTIRLPQTPTAAVLAPFYNLYAAQQSRPGNWSHCEKSSSSNNNKKDASTNTNERREGQFSVAPRRGRKPKRTHFHYQKKVPIVGEVNKSSGSGSSSARTLSSSDWLNAVPHIVFGRHSALPSATQLSHFCVSRCQAKVVYVHSAALHAHLKREATLITRTQGGSDHDSSSNTVNTAKYIAPYHLLINYGENNVYVNRTAVSQHHSIVLVENDIISFLEDPFSVDGGVLDAVADLPTSSSGGGGGDGHADTLNDPENSNLSTMSSANHSTSSISQMLPTTQQHADSFASIQNSSLQSFLSHYIRQTLREMVRSVAHAPPPPTHHKTLEETKDNSNGFVNSRCSSCDGSTSHGQAPVATAGPSTRADPCLRAMNTIYGVSRPTDGTAAVKEGGEAGSDTTSLYPLAVLRPPTVEDGVVHYSEWKRLTHQRELHYHGNKQSDAKNNKNSSNGGSGSFFVQGDELVLEKSWHDDSHGQEKETVIDGKRCNSTSKRRRAETASANTKTKSHLKRIKEEDQNDNSNRLQTQMLELQKYLAYFADDYSEVTGTIYSPLQSYITLNAAEARREVEVYYNGAFGHQQTAGEGSRAAAAASPLCQEQQRESQEEDDEQKKEVLEAYTVQMSPAEKKSPFKSILAELQAMQCGRDSVDVKEEKEVEETKGMRLF